jgi:hypothetical protein
MGDGYEYLVWTVSGFYWRWLEMRMVRNWAWKVELCGGWIGTKGLYSSYKTLYPNLHAINRARALI